MSEQLLRLVALSELTLVRIVCRGQASPGLPDTPCNAVIEVPLERLISAFRQPSAEPVWCCPCCKSPYHLSDSLGKPLDPFSPLVKAIHDLNSLKARFDVQFVLPQKAS